MWSGSGSNAKAKSVLTELSDLLAAAVPERYDDWEMQSNVSVSLEM